MLPPAPPAAVASTSERVVATLDELFSWLGPTQARAQAAWPYGPAPSAATPVISGMGSTNPCEHYTPNKVNHFDLFRAMGQSWRGCVEARPAPFNTTDAPPVRGNPDSLFVPYLWPDERDGDGSVRNDYIRFDPRTQMPSWVGWNPSDTGTRNWDVLNLAWVWKYNGARPTIDDASFTQRGPNGGCPAPIVPLTNTRTPLVNAIDNLRVYGQGGTIISEGLAWAWRTLSPEAPFDEGRPYNTRGNRKIIVLMTDGANFVIQQNNSQRSDYGAYGYASQRRLGTNDIDQMRERIDERTRDICRAVKDPSRNIIVYTILFDPDGALAGTPTDLMRNCATSPDRHFFRAGSSSQLVEAFTAIGGEIAKLRLRR